MSFPISRRSSLTLNDRILWWVSAVVTWLVLEGVARLIVKMTRRPEIPGISQSGRNDQFAGFFLGAAKGLLIAAFLAAGIQNYALEQMKNVSWAEDQAKASWALKWNETYQPARKIWASQPVRHFVKHIQRMGLPPADDASETRGDEQLEDESVLRTASRQVEAVGAGGSEHSSQSTSPSSSSRSNANPPAEAPPSSNE